jgi:hypothetical protein
VHDDAVDELRHLLLSTNANGGLTPNGAARRSRTDG